MTLRELLACESLNYLRVINGNAELDRYVSSIESTETPDVVEYVAKDSFIITTAMIYKNNQQELCELILKLSKLPCAGLGIKIGRFLDRLDDKVIETADSVGFPLISIPMNQTLGNVYHSFLSEIWNTKNKMLTEVLNIQRKYNDLIIHGTTLRRLLSIISTTIRKGLLIIDRLGMVTAYCNTSLVEKHMARALVAEIDKDFCFCESKYLYNEERQENAEVMIYPIKSITQNMRYLVTFDYKKEANNSNHLTEEIVLILGMFFYKEMFVHYNEIHLRNEYLKMIINNDRESNEKLLKMLHSSQMSTLNQNVVYRVLVFRLWNFRGEKFQPTQMSSCEEQYIMIYEYLIKKVRKLTDHMVMVFPDVESWQYVLITQDDDAVLEKTIRDFKGIIEKELNTKLVLAFGNRVFDLSMLGSSYWDAVENLDKTVNPPEDGMIYYQPKQVIDLLNEISDKHINIVCRNVMKSLAFPENETEAELRKTLKTYLDCRCSIIDAASRLYVHRNTVRYRIAKCEEIMNLDLTDANVCYQLTTCILLSERLQRKQQ